MAEIRRRSGSSQFRSFLSLAAVLVAAMAVLAVSCTPDPGGGGGGPTPGRFTAVPRDPGPCGPDQPIAPSGYFARADISVLATREGSANWIAALAGWNMSSGGNLGIHWGNAMLGTPTALYQGVYAYPVNFVNTQTNWDLQQWNVGIPIVNPAPVFEPQPALIYPEVGKYPRLRSRTGVQAWHLGSPDIWGGGDRHVLFRDSATCQTYELQGVHRDGNGTPPNNMTPFDPIVGDAAWASGGVTWDANLTPESYFRQTYWEPRGVGAATIPITPMVLRLDEVARNVEADSANPAPLDHALYWASATPDNDALACGKFVWPARHMDCGHGATSVDPMKPSQGAWLRLRSDFDDSAYSPQMKVIIRTLKTRGMVFADGTASVNTNGIFAEPAGCQGIGGSTVALTDPSKCWTPDSMSQLTSMPIGLSQFEVVDPTAMRLDPNLEGGRADQPDSPDLWKCSPSFDCG